MTAPMPEEDPAPLPAGELALASDELVLVDTFKANAVAAYAFDSSGEQLLVHCTFAGRANHGSERRQITAAMHPEIAVELAIQLVAAADLLSRRQQQTGGRS